MQPSDNLIDPAGSNHGVLSHRAGKHLQNFVEGDRASFDEADEQTDVSETFKRPSSPRKSPGPSHSSGTTANVWNRSPDSVPTLTWPTTGGFAKRLATLAPTR